MNEVADVVQTECLEQDQVNVQERVAVVKPYVDDYVDIVPPQPVADDYFQTTTWILSPEQNPGDDIIPYLTFEGAAFRYIYTEGPVIENQERYSHAGPQRSELGDGVFSIHHNIQFSPTVIPGTAFPVFDYTNTDHGGDEVITEDEIDDGYESTPWYTNLPPLTPEQQLQARMQYVESIDSHDLPLVEEVRQVIRSSLLVEDDMPVGIIAYMVRMDEERVQTYVNTRDVVEPEDFYELIPRVTTLFIIAFTIVDGNLIFYYRFNNHSRIRIIESYSSRDGHVEFALQQARIYL